MRDETAIDQLKESAKNGELIVIFGTGSSIGLTDNAFPALSWTGLIESGFDYGIKKGCITTTQKNTWNNQLRSTDIDELLGAAEFMGRKLDAPNGDLYARWLEATLKNIVPNNNSMADAIRKINDTTTPICTLNYDTLLEKVTRLPTVNLLDIKNATAWVRREISGIMHLHGCWDTPTSCILGIRDYERTLHNEPRDLIQRHLSTFKRILFIGCGDTFSDPNFSALIRWLRVQLPAATPQHYALVHESQLAQRHADRAWHGFVEPVSYGDSHIELPPLISEIFSDYKKTNSPETSKPAQRLQNIELINEYRAFLVKDCGQMTIEGVRADMDTAQRRFDLERLFVPLKLSLCPPEILPQDPQREQKLKLWFKKNNSPESFGDVFRKAKGLALLALPGGGKTLLLKRLAVAYASPDRREKSNDDLPDIDITPILIKCREWRDHIKLPLPTILKKIGEITGNSNLSGLYTALTPLLQEGKILLLIDGLDEIHNDADRSIFVDNLQKFLDEYPNIKLVVTSREAGFSLVAPCIARFCEQWRVAPLDRDAIVLLCDYWQQLMAGDSPEAKSDAMDVSNHLLGSASLRRLAENPLLLTMLLVVKNGAGRLPPDRVSLYGRAVEVLLDTWNIKGHDALNPKEAVPQLAYIAYELMQQGKQTATEKELLELLETARQKVPQIKRYAKDTPYEFLKRVELRSSLLLEAGHVIENGFTVPFYQFRHLTFQEYLSAKAITDGHYAKYKNKSSILIPLISKLDSEEWKEVIPMTAVLSRKQAEPLICALVKEANILKYKIENNLPFPGEKQWLSYPYSLPSPASLLLQSLIEEAEAEPATLTAALKIIIFFSKGCSSENDWHALARGPFKEELLTQSWLLYRTMNWPFVTSVRNTYATFAAYRKPEKHWKSIEGITEILDLLSSESPENITLGLMTVVGLIYHSETTTKGIKNGNTIFFDDHIEKIEQHIFSNDPAINNVAAWTWGLIRYRQKRQRQRRPKTLVLDALLQLWVDGNPEKEGEMAGFAIYNITGTNRNYWQPVLTDIQKKYIRECLSDNTEEELSRNNYGAALVVAFHSHLLKDHELLALIQNENVPYSISEDTRYKKGYQRIISQLDGSRI